MELKVAINKLFEMTDEERHAVFGHERVEDVLDNCHTDNIIRLIENFSSPKYGDVYIDEEGFKLVILDGGYSLCERYECPQKFSLNSLVKYYTKTGKNIADKLGGLFQ